MKSSIVRYQSARWSVVTAVALSGVLSAGDTSVAQYYYQPAPSYYQNDTVGGTVVGGALGAITGAVVGGKSHRGEGALIGAGVGALTGNVLGRAQDRADEQRAVQGASVVAGMNQQVAAQAVTNYDLVGMTRAGVSEDVIISTMQSRGARLDLSPQGLIALKQSGVSDRVVLAAQNLGAGPAYVAAAAPSAVIVAPPPRVYYRPVHYYYGPGPFWHGHCHHHW